MEAQFIVKWIDNETICIEMCFYDHRQVSLRQLHILNDGKVVITYCDRHGNVSISTNKGKTSFYVSKYGINGGGWFSIDIPNKGIFDMIDSLISLTSSMN